MATIGYHLVKTTYGTWLPGDARGHWSSIRGDDRRYIEHGKLHEGDEERLALARRQMKHPPTYLTSEMMEAIEETLAGCAAASEWVFAAGSIEPTHIHLLITYSGRPIQSTAKWLSHQMTLAVRQRTNFDGPLWTHGDWEESITDEGHWRNLVAYIERHNIRRGLDPRPYKFLR